MRVVIKQDAAGFEVGTDAVGNLTLFVEPELLPDEVLVELARTLESVTGGRAAGAA